MSQSPDICAKIIDAIPEEAETVEILAALGSAVSSVLLLTCSTTEDRMAMAKRFAETVVKCAEWDKNEIEMRNAKLNTRH